MKEDISRVRLSYGRSIASPGFLDRFYEIFLSSDPKVARKFKNTDLKKQQELLAMSVNMVILFPQQNKIARNAISRIQASHGRDGLDIESHYYQLWTESLLQAVSEHDSEFNEELAQSWRRVVQVAIDFILEGY